MKTIVWFLCQVAIEESQKEKSVVKITIQPEKSKRRTLVVVNSGLSQLLFFFKTNIPLLPFFSSLVLQLL
jgi:hypothetical protein